MKNVVRIAAIAGMVLASAAQADDGDDNKFKLRNNSAASAIEFVTVLKNGKWSTNWLSTPIKPAQVRALTFKEGDDRCEIRTRITFSDGSKFDTPIDYCGIEEVIATDEKLYSK